MSAATVLTSGREVEAREPLYRVHERMPRGDRATVLDRVEWAIECTMQAAYDAADDDLLVLLSSLAPGLDGTLLAGVERLIDLGEEVYGAGRCGDYGRRRCAEAEYADELTVLARAVIRAVRGVRVVAS